MKHVLLSLLSVLPVTAFAAGPFSLSTSPSTGAGSLTFSTGSPGVGVYSDGHIEGDTGTFNPGVGTPNTTLWSAHFMVHNVTDNATHWSEKSASGHTPVVPDGTVANTASTISNTGINLGNNVTANLALALTQPAAGDTARVSWTWTFNNAAASAKTIRVLWFCDTDLYLKSPASFQDDMVAAVGSAFHSGKAIGIGENASGNVDLNQGILMDCTVPPTKFAGFAVPLGVSDYWDNTAAYSGQGPALTKEIDPALANKVQNDANNDNKCDAPGDCGGAIQVDLVVPASGSNAVTFHATWGANQTLSRVGNWEVY